ncbi:hypothetical protein [Actinobacillus capsulatus]|uniref:hypothetical protein n=1 Tax=Actinobacillus capsulatus TaxID=717 RepID=UPI000382DEBE|nr:hypothetical protein [Actinobacillus capsulatus]
MQLTSHLTGWSEEENREAINSWASVFDTRSKEETTIIDNFNSWLFWAQHTEFTKIKLNGKGDIENTIPIFSRDVAGLLFSGRRTFCTERAFFIFLHVLNKVNAGRVKEVAIRALVNAKMLDKSRRFVTLFTSWKKRTIRKFCQNPPTCSKVFYIL